MLIRELAQQTGVPAKTIRYYESVGLMPPPQRGDNNYRHYTPADAERLRLIASARSLGVSVSDIADILAARDAGIPPCERVLQTLDQRMDAVDRRIADLLTLRDTLRQLRQHGAALPLDDLRGERCICYLLKTYRDSGQVRVEREGLSDG